MNKLAFTRYYLASWSHQGRGTTVRETTGGGTRPLVLHVTSARTKAFFRNPAEHLLKPESRLFCFFYPDDSHPPRCARRFQ